MSQERQQMRNQNSFKQATQQIDNPFSQEPGQIRMESLHPMLDEKPFELESNFMDGDEQMDFDMKGSTIAFQNHPVEERHRIQDDDSKMKDCQRLKIHDIGRLESSKEMGQMTIEEDSSQQIILHKESKNVVQADFELIPQVPQQAEMDKLRGQMINNMEENQTKDFWGTEGSLMIQEKISNGFFPQKNSNDQNYQVVSEIKESQENQERCSNEHKIDLNQGDYLITVPKYIIPSVTDPTQRIQEQHQQVQPTQSHPQEHQHPQQHQSPFSHNSQLQYNPYPINPSIIVEQSFSANILLEAKQQKRQTFEPHQIKLFPQYLGNILGQKQQYTGSDYSSDECVKRESKESIQGDMEQFISKVLLQKQEGNMQNQGQNGDKVKTDATQSKFVSQLYNSGCEFNSNDPTVKAYIQHIAYQQKQAQDLKQRYGQSISSESQFIKSSYSLFEQKSAPKIIKFPFQAFSQNEQLKTALKQFYGQQKQQQPFEDSNQRLLQQFKYEHYELLPQFVSSPQTETFNKYILNMERTLVDEYELCKFNEDRLCSGSQQQKLQLQQTEIKEIKPSMTYKQSKGNVLIQSDQFIEAYSKYQNTFESQDYAQLKQNQSKHQLSKRQQRPQIMTQTQLKSLKSQLIPSDQSQQPIEQQPHDKSNHNQISPDFMSQQILPLETQLSSKQSSLEHKPISNEQLSENTQKNNHISTISDKLIHVTFERQQQLPKHIQMSSQNHQPFSPNSVDKPIVNEISIDQADNDTPVFGQDNNFVAFAQSLDKTVVTAEFTGHHEEPSHELSHNSTDQEKIQEEKPQQENNVQCLYHQAAIKHNSVQIDVNIPDTLNNSEQKPCLNAHMEIPQIPHTCQQESVNVTTSIAPQSQQITPLGTSEPHITNTSPQTSQQVFPSIQSMTAEELRQFIKNTMSKKPAQTYHHTQTHHTEPITAKAIVSPSQPHHVVQQIPIHHNVSSLTQKPSQIIELQQDDPTPQHQVPQQTIITNFQVQQHDNTFKQHKEKQPIQNISEDKALSQSNCQDRSLSASEVQFIQAQTPTFVTNEAANNNNAIVLEDDENNSSSTGKRNTVSPNVSEANTNIVTDQAVVPSLQQHNHSMQSPNSKANTSPKQIIQIDLQDSEESIEVPLKPLEPNSQQKDNVEEVVAPPEDSEVKPPPVVSATEIRNVLLQTYPTLVQVIKAASDDEILGLYFELTTGKEQSSSNQGTNPSNTVDTPPLQQTPPNLQQTTNVSNSEQAVISQTPETIALEEAQPQQQPAPQQFKPSLTYEELQVIIQTLLESNTDNPELKGQLEKLSREQLLELYQEGLRESANIATNENASNSASNPTAPTDRKKRKNEKKADKQIINLEDEDQQQRNNEQRKISNEFVSEPLQSTFQPSKPSTFSYLPIYHQTLLHRHPKQSKPLQLLTVNKTLLTEYILSQDYKKMFTYLNGSNGESVQFVDSVIKQIVTTVLSKVLGKNAEIQTGLEIVKRQGQPVNVNTANKAIFIPSKPASAKQVTLPTIPLQTKTDIVPYIAVPQISAERKQRILELRKQRFGTKSFEPVTQSSPASLLARSPFNNKKYRYCLIVQEEEQLDERQSLRLEESIGLEGDKRKRVKVSIEKDESKVINMLNNFTFKTNRMEIEN